MKMKELARKKDKNPYKHIRFKTKNDWYMYWLCEDKEFLDGMTKILTFVSTRWSAMTDEEGAKFGQMVRDIQAKYSITEDEYETVHAAYHRISNFDFPFRYIETEGDEVIIAIPGTITRTEYLEAWGEVEDMLIREEVRQTSIGSRRRSPENPQLIYAIFKARKKGKKFSEIFTHYQDGKLDQYRGSTKQFSSSDNLERYYNKYKPDR